MLTHTNPDPDAIAAGVGLGHLVREALGLEAAFAYEGDIYRAENKAMVALLGLPVLPMARIRPQDFEGFALVDSQPGFGNTVLPGGLVPLVVIDHHVSPEAAGPPAPFEDIRTDAGATSTLIADYLRQAGVDLPAELATALFYGIRTDTADFSRGMSDLDEQARSFLGPLVDRSLLHAILRPALPPAYFRALKGALERARIYGPVILCSLGRTENPEMVAEVADLLVRLEGAAWAICGGLFKGLYFLSVRAAEGQGKDAWLLLSDVMRDQGSFGGHGTVAGGRIRVVDDSDRGLRRLEASLKRGLLEALGERGTAPRRLGG